MSQVTILIERLHKGHNHLEFMNQVEFKPLKTRGDFYVVRPPCIISQP